MMHKDVNHTQHIHEQSVDTVNYNTNSSIKQEVKEEVKELDEGEGVNDSNLVDYSQYVQVQMNITK